MRRHNITRNSNAFIYSCSSKIRNFPLSWKTWPPVILFPSVEYHQWIASWRHKLCSLIEPTVRGLFCVHLLVKIFKLCIIIPLSILIKNFFITPKTYAMTCMYLNHSGSHLNGWVWDMSIIIPPPNQPTRRGVNQNLICEPFVFHSFADEEAASWHWYDTTNTSRKGNKDYMIQYYSIPIEMISETQL